MGRQDVISCPAQRPFAKLIDGELINGPVGVRVKNYGRLDRNKGDFPLQPLRIL